LRKKVIQIFLIVCLVLTVAVGGCTRSETSALSPNPNQPEEVIPEPIIEEEPISPPLVDSDGDGFSDEFEINIAHTDPNIPNDRYVIVFEYWEEGLDNNGADRAWHFFREVAGIPAKNIIVLRGKEAVYSSFQKAIEEVAAKADENDIVCLSINAHSGIVGYPYLKTPEIEAKIKADPNFCWSDYVEEHGHPGYPGIRYTDLDEWLDEIRARVIMINACPCDFIEKGVPVLKDGCCPRIILEGPTYYCFLDPSFKNFTEADENGNKDGYVSMGEIKDYVNYIYYKDDPNHWNYHEWVVDTSNIASEIYLIDPSNIPPVIGNP